MSDYRYITTPSRARSGQPVLPARGLEGGGRGERDHPAGERNLPRLPRQQARRENGANIHIFYALHRGLESYPRVLLGF